MQGYKIALIEITLISYYLKKTPENNSDVFSYLT